jgi:DNA-binding transcriptional LysR family regulator
VGRVDDILTQHNLNRHIALSIPHFLVAPFVLAQTDLIATLAERVARTFARSQNLKIFPLPFAMDGFSVFMRWHESNRNHPAHVWLRELIAEVCREIFAANQ